MSQKAEPPTTQRAYTLRLQGTDRSDQSWRDALWQTHHAANKGSKAFGDWLLTMRGGLDHTLADAKIKGEKKEPDRDPTPPERKDRRILLALSWLSVESKRGAPKEFLVASGHAPAENRNGQVIKALERILEKRGVPKPTIGLWIDDCSASLSAAIRDDAVWINRSKAYDVAVSRIGETLTREELWDLLGRFYNDKERGKAKSAYLACVQLSDVDSSGSTKEEKAKDLVEKAGQWLSSRFGTGKGADFPRFAGAYEMIENWACTASPGVAGTDAIADLASRINPAFVDLDDVLGEISGPGYQSSTRNFLQRIADTPAITQEDLAKLKDTAADDKDKSNAKTGSKGQRPYSNTILASVESDCGFTYRVDAQGQPVPLAEYSKYNDSYKWGPARHSEFAVMLDHAARRVSMAHTWIKRAEAERREFEEDAKRIGHVSKAARKWLDVFCLGRSRISGAIEPYRIRRRAIGGWKEVVAAWSKSSCKTRAERVAAARAVQADPEVDKFGDVQLFEALAEDDALCVWHKDGDTAKAPDPQPLIDYARAAQAKFQKRHFKVPAYRHPDALLHPVFCDFGKSRWEIQYSAHKACKGLAKARNRVRKTSEAVRKAEDLLEKARGKKTEAAEEKKLQEARKTLENDEREVARLSDPRQLTMRLWDGQAVARMPLRWQSKRLSADLALEQDQQACERAEVARADRLGRAASDATGTGRVVVSGLFEQNDWNGRLQAPRKQMEAIATRVAEHGWDEKAVRMRGGLQWLVTFSAKLQPQGPWHEYARSFSELAPARPYVAKKGDCAVKHEGNDKRTAKLILSRLRGIRVLSVDLGHRHAAACAVWEAVDAEQVKQACVASGRGGPKERD